MSESVPVVTGFGMVTPLGDTADEVLRSVRAARSAIGLVTAFEPRGDAVMAAEVPDFDIEAILGSKKTYLDPSARFFLAACAHALRDSSILDAGADRDRVAIGYGSAFGPLESVFAFEQRLREKGPRLANPILFSHAYINTAPSLAAIEWRIRGPNATFCSGRTSGMAAIAWAVDVLALDMAAGAIVGGSDALSEPAYAGLAATGAISLSDDPADPRGMVPGEGAAVLAVETASAAAERGSSPRAELLCASVTRDACPGHALSQALASCLEALAVKSSVSVCVSPESGDPELDCLASRAIADSDLLSPDAEVLRPAFQLGETFGAAGPLYVALAITAAPPNGVALAATLDRQGYAAAVLARRFGGSQ